MILTRCSFCGTASRVNPEQLRLRHGQVRCGQCQAVFNALDFLEEGQEFYDLLQKTTAARIPEVPVPTLDPIPVRQGMERGRAPEPPPPMPAPERRPPPVASAPPPPSAKAQTTRAAPSSRTPPPPPPSPVADSKREELLSFSEPRYRRWPYVLVTLLFSGTLLAQIFYAYRTPISSNFPVVGTAFKALKIKVPPPRVTDLVLIDSSDLQIDQGKDQYLFSATLRNRAPYAQDWPLLELTLMDAADAPLSRRVLYPADYLPADAPRTFPASGALAVKLWLSAKGLKASNYNLYLFYP